jgi:hypothetical protein
VRKKQSEGERRRELGESEGREDGGGGGGGGGKRWYDCGLAVALGVKCSGRGATAKRGPPCGQVQN